MLNNNYQIVTKTITCLLICLLLSTQKTHAQFLMDMIDTTKDVGKGMFSVYKKFDRVNIGGYIQPQFQVAEAEGAKGFSGGDFPQHVNNRFSLRRGRLKVEYARFTTEGQPSVQFVFQFDGSERGFFTRDFWGRFFEQKYKLFSGTAGMFARPFGYELNLGSADRESPERGRMSQLLMKVERDLGAMVSFEPRGRKNFLKYIKWDAGFFNGQGLNATADFDSHKDFISRLSLKPLPLSKHLFLSAGLSYFNGGFLQNTKYTYETKDINGSKVMTVDSSATNLFKEAPRKYYGGDVQLKWKRRKGNTELRAEYWNGTQTATEATTETPFTLLNEPYYVRNFDGAFFYLLHSFYTHHQVGIKYDWYDPNTKVAGSEIGKTGANINATNIRYNTLGFGYINSIEENLKLTLWYEIITNEKTQLAGYTNDLKDNVFTCRLQFRF